MSCDSNHKPTSVTILLNMMCVNNVELCDRKTLSNFFKMLNYLPPKF